MTPRFSLPVAYLISRLFERRAEKGERDQKDEQVKVKALITDKVEKGNCVQDRVERIAPVVEEKPEDRRIARLSGLLAVAVVQYLVSQPYKPAGRFRRKC